MKLKDEGRAPRARWGKCTQVRLFSRGEKYEIRELHGNTNCSHPHQPVAVTNSHLRSITASRDETQFWWIRTADKNRWTSKLVLDFSSTWKRNSKLPTDSIAAMRLHFCANPAWWFFFMAAEVPQHLFQFPARSSANSASIRRGLQRNPSRVPSCYRRPRAAARNSVLRMRNQIGRLA